MAGWLKDFFLYWWALFYWNIRKTWFRLRGAHRDSCPCQEPGDSGHALDSRCVAVAAWHRPERFQRVCPLLTSTPAGWRCRVDAERVRPFWGRAILAGLAACLALYLVGGSAIYATLRLAKYEVKFATVVWPPAWSELRGAQEKLHAQRAAQALAAGDYAGALLALERVCALNPRNYQAALSLAGLSQVAGRDSVAEHVYARLMRDVPEERPATAQHWIRLLLARADFPQIKSLASAMLTEDPTRRASWLHCFLVAARLTQDPAALEALLQQHSNLPDWCSEIIRIELLILQGRTEQAVAQLVRANFSAGNHYPARYQIDRLLGLDRPIEATEILAVSDNLVPVDEAAFFRLRAALARNWLPLVGAEYEALLQLPMTPRLTEQFCAWFLRRPDPVAFARFADRFFRAGPPLTRESLAQHQAVYLTAIVNQDQVHAAQAATAIAAFTTSPNRALIVLGELLATPRPAVPVSQILPAVPLPVEILYAILDRSAGSARE